MQIVCALMLDGAPDWLLGLWAPTHSAALRRCGSCCRRMGTAWPRDLKICRHCIYQCQTVSWYDLQLVEQWLATDVRSQRVQLWGKPLRIQMPMYGLNEDGMERIAVPMVLSVLERRFGTDSTSTEAWIPGIVPWSAPLVHGMIDSSTQKTYIWLELISQRTPM